MTLHQQLQREFPMLWRACLSKVKYATRQEALNAPQRSNWRLKTYHCSHCGCWHRTKKFVVK